MPAESWLVLTVAAAFLLVGIAASPLAWVALHSLRSRSEQLTERRIRELAERVRGLEILSARFESDAAADAARRSFHRADSPGAHGSHRAESPAGRGSQRADSPPGRDAVAAVLDRVEPALIAVPNLESASHDRAVTLAGLKERYAAIWALADTGAAPEWIARATGHPIGQIELILGLRRRIDEARTTISHAAHG